MGEQRKHVIVVGGGVSGLSAAFYMQKLSARHGNGLAITIVEENAQFGGKIKTLRKDNYIIERGPDSFLARKTAVIDLTRELGLENELVATNPKAQKTYILHKGKLHKMPAGLVLGIPTKVWPFVQTGLLSPLGKARAALDLVLPRRAGKEDESLGHFIERRLGTEVLAHIAEPLLAGIYAGETKSLSLMATFPQFYAAEQQHRSLILGMLRGKTKSAAVPLPPSLPPAAQKSMFLSYRQGLYTLVESLAMALGGAGQIFGTSVLNIARKADAYAVKLSDGQELYADAVVVAAPAFAAAKMLASIPGSGYLSQIPYVSVANVVLGFAQSDIGVAMDGSGFVIPRTEGRTLTACTWTSAKWLHTAPANKAVLRCYIGRAGAEVTGNLSDGEMIEKVRQEIKEIMGITEKPLFAEVSRWEHAMPQYPVGHLARLAETRSAIREAAPGIVLAGSGYNGVGIPDCIRQGKEAAERAVEFLYQAAK
ncbi:MAG TPA: protoporphyrinogen oxidase [Bacilli bacterium]